MDPYLGYEIAILLVLVYALVVYFLYRAGYLGPERALSLFGPALMIKTRRGRAWIDRVGRFRRFWSFLADAGITLAAVSMISIVALLLVEAALALQLPASAAPQVSEALGIPGINPIIPVTYGIVALVVGVVIHELFHGFVARSQGIGVKSLGILWVVVPVGAFVEQDDEDMTKAPLRRRDRVAAAGVLANFILALVFFLAVSGLVASSVQPNATGVGILYVVPSTPASNATLAAGDIITSINGTATPTPDALIDYLDASHPGQVVELTFYSSAASGVVTKSVTLESAETYSHQSSDANKGFLGVESAFLTPTQLKGTYVAPWNGPGGPISGAFDWVVLPLAGLQPMQGPAENFFHLSGPLGGMNAGDFWILVNVLYWLAWIDLLLGLSNALPLFPLDGGLLFRDFVQSIAQRVKRGWDAKQLDRFAGQAATFASLLVVVLIVWQFVVPRLHP